MILLISLLRLPATFFHELSHFVFAILTFSRVKDFTLIPKIQGRYITLGSVNVIPSFKGALILIGFAPFALWFLAFYISYYKVIIYNEFITWITVIYLMLGGVPSKQDLKSALDGVFSFSGMIVLFVISVFLKFLFSEIF